MGPFLNEKYNWTNKKRAFQLTTDCIKQNPANYTVWEYRRQIIKALNIELDSEFAWTSSIIARNIKNFQVWHHRQVSATFIISTQPIRERGSSINSKMYF